MIMLMTSQEKRLRDEHKADSLLSIQYFEDSEKEIAEIICKDANAYFAENLSFLKCSLQYI